MKPLHAVKIFTDKYPFIGPTTWMLSFQYFAIQIVAAQAWSTSFSLQLNPISDLGNTVCGIYSDRYVCSPLHALMNASFIMLGITMASGSLLIYQEFNKSRASLFGFSSMALAGIGTLMVGVFPENTVGFLHASGAALPFLVGNVGMVILSRVLALPKALRIYTGLSGAVSLLALALFISHTYLGLGIGGMERVVAYPQTVWLIVFGMYMSRSRIMKQRKMNANSKNKNS